MIAALAGIVVLGQTELVLKGFDPIELIAGRETEGKPEFSATYLRHEYRFASKENRDLFQKDPVRFAVQNGGACGRMGALSGKGSPERYAVVRGKIYLFASSACHSGFVKNPDPFFAERPAPPKSNPEAAKKADALLAEARKAHGLKPGRPSPRIHWVVLTPYKEGGQDKLWHSHYAVDGPNRFAQWEVWDAGRSFFVIDGKKSAEGYPHDFYAMHPGEIRALTAQLSRHPAAVLCGAGGRAVASTDHAVTMVRDDIVFDVHLDPKSRRINRVSYRDFVGGPMRAAEVEYSDYEQSDGIWLPMSWRTRYDNGDWTTAKRIASYSVNGDPPQPFADAFGKK